VGLRGIVYVEDEEVGLSFAADLKDLKGWVICKVEALCYVKWRVLSYIAAYIRFSGQVRYRMVV